MANSSEKEDLVSVSSLGLQRVDTISDAQPIVKLIQDAKKVKILSLVGTSVGVEAAQAIGQAVAEHPELQEVWWADMFVSRLKNEIPDALIHLGNGLSAGNCRLTVLDLSDNAIGPVGFKGLGPWLVSPVCYGLEELKLNNTGMGPHGAGNLANALQELVDCTKGIGGFKLKSFVCGRSRLENEGATKIAGVFSQMSHLEKIVIPQDGIAHEGISAMCSALKNHPRIRHIDFSDNTLTKPGSDAVARLLPELKYLEVLILGDCLLSDEGATSIASALEHSHLPNFKHLSIQYNEINLESILAVVESLEQKTALELFEISGNPIGRAGADQVESMLDALGKANVLGELIEIDDDYEDEDDDDRDTEGDEDTENNQSEVVKGSRLDDKSNTNVESFLVRGGGIKTNTSTAKSSNPLVLLFTEVAATTEARSGSPIAVELNKISKKVPTVPIDRSWIAELASRFPFNLELSLHLLVLLASNADDNGEFNRITKFGDSLLLELKSFYSSPQSPMASFNNGLASAFLSAFGLIKGEALKNARRALPTKGSVWRLVAHLNNQPYFSGASRIIRSFLDATASSGWGAPFSPGSHQEIVRKHLIGSLGSST